MYYILCIKVSLFHVVVNMGATEGEDVLQIRMMTSSSLRVLSKELSLRREEPGKLGYDWYRGMDASKCRQKSAIHWIRGFKDCIIPEQQNKLSMKEKHSMCLFHICNLLSFNTLNDPICSLDLEFQFSKIFFYFSFTLSAFKLFQIHIDTKEMHIYAEW